MAMLGAASPLLSAALEGASLVWMELAMFSVAALIYSLGAGRLPGGLGGAGKKKVPAEGQKISPRGTPKASKGGSPRSGSPSGTPRSATSETGPDLAEHAALLEAWRRDLAANAGAALGGDLPRVLEAMQKLGQSAADVVVELRAAVASNPGLLQAVVALPPLLLRDDAVEMLGAVLGVLEELGTPAEPVVYAGLMAAQLRRRDYEAVAATAARLPEEALTAKARGVMAAAAAHRGRLQEALDHLAQLPEPEEGARTAVPPSAVAQLLALAARERRAVAAAVELRRVGARLAPQQLDELLAAEGRRRGGGSAGCRELLAAAEALQVAKGPGAYRAQAAALAQAGDVPGLSTLLAELEEQMRGVSGSAASCSAAASEVLVQALLEACGAVRSADLARRCLELHRVACGGPVGARALSAACGALLACDRSGEACELYERDMEARRLVPDAALIDVLLRAAAQAGRAALAQRLADLAVSSKAPGAGAGCELQRCATLIKAHAKERNLAGAAAVFDRLVATGQPLSPMIHNCFLDACVQCGDADRAAAHFEGMKQLGFADVVGYNTMLKAHLARGRTEEALALVREMADRGLKANKVTYNELLHAKVLARDRRGAWALVEEMRAAGVKPNSVTCSILLKSLTAQSTAADLQRVTTLIQEVDEPLDEVLVSSVIEACIRTRQLDLLSDLMQGFRQRGGALSLSAPTYGSMIKAYGQVGNVVRVRELWADMEERGVKPTSITLGCMVEALVVNHQAEAAWELVHQQLAAEDRRSCINTVIYSTVLKGFASTRRMDKVFAVYKEMRAGGIACNTITFNTLLDACAKCSAMDRASRLLEDMREACAEPDVITYSTIIKGYCLAGDVDRAFQVLAEMKRDGKFVPDEIMYNSVLDGCAKQHRVEEALQLLEEMKAAGIGPSNYTLSILVKLLGHARRLPQAFKMVEELSSQHGFRPNVQVYTCLVQACVQNRRLERALALHEAMVSEGCAADDKFYAVLVRGCLQLQQPMKALEVARSAFGLPGSSPAATGRGGSAVGVEARALDELVSRLQAGGADERAALARLAADLEHRGVRLGEQRGAQGRATGAGGGRRR